MKKLIGIVILLFLVSCSTFQVDQPKAVSKVDKLKSITTAKKTPKDFRFIQAMFYSHEARWITMSWYGQKEISRFGHWDTIIVAFTDTRKGKQKLFGIQVRERLTNETNDKLPKERTTACQYKTGGEWHKIKTTDSDYCLDALKEFADYLIIQEQQRRVY